MDNNIDIILNKIIKSLLITLISIMLIITGIFIIPVQYSYAAVSEVPYFSSRPDIDALEASGFAYAKSTYNKNAYVGSGNDATRVAYISSTNQFIFFCPQTSSSLQYYYSTLDSEQSYNSAMVTSYGDYYYGLQNAGSHLQELYVDSYQSIADAIADYNNIKSNGTFYTFPQADDDTYITYEYIEGNGVMVYASPNTYHLFGTYSSSSAPFSQYCYISNGDYDTSFAVFSSVPLTVYSSFLNGGTYTYGVCTQYDTNKYYYVFPETIVSNIEGSFDSLDAAKSAFTGASGSEGSGVVTAGALTIDLPAGNVIYVHPRPGSLARLEVRYPYLSNSFGNPFPLSAYWASGVSSLPDSSTTMPLSGMNQIAWSVDTSSVNGYGQSYNGFTTHAPFNSGWFVVYNPTYYLFNSGDSSANIISPTVTIKMQYATEYYIYDLSMNLVDNSSVSNTGYDTSQHGTINPNNPNQWDNTSTLPNSEPSVGGQQNEIVEAQNFSVTDYLNSIKETLNKFANDFVQLLTAPIAHIKQLVTYATAFMQSISQFFVWLPEPVYAVLVSALVIAVVIGVLKLLF